MGQGCGVGWLSPSLPILMADDSLLKSGPITKDEAGWIGAIQSIGSMFGTFIFGLLTNCIGTKNTMLIYVIPTLVIIYNPKDTKLFLNLILF